MCIDVCSLYRAESIHIPEEIIAECVPNLVKVKNVLDTKCHANKTTMSKETPRLSYIVVNC